MKPGDELESVATFMEWLAARNPGEQEFHQAVEGVAQHVLDLARETPDFATNRILQRLTEPDRVISFRVVWEDDEHAVRINRGFRVQHTNAIGPYKGGLRFDPSVDRSVLKFLAFEQTFKNSLTGLNLGAGKGGADLDPRGLSDSEMMRFCYAFMTELFRHIGSETDVPAGDIGVGAREIGYLFGQYKRLQNQFTGAITGKPPGSGGSELRQEATGWGAIYFLCAMLGETGEEIEGKRLAISGAGNVALHVAEKAVSLGGSPVSLSNRQGTLRKDAGLSLPDIELAMDRYPRTRDLGEVAEAVGGQWLPGEKPWSTECEVAVPASTQNELDEADATILLERGVRFVIEAANMPLTPGATRRFKDTGVLIAPGKAANAGGVVVSGFEMAQNRVGRSWTTDRLDRDLRDTMARIFDQIKAESDGNGPIDYCRGADRAGFRRVAKALVSFGRV